METKSFYPRPLERLHTRAGGGENKALAKGRPADGASGGASGGKKQGGGDQGVERAGRFLRIRLAPARRNDRLAGKEYGGTGAGGEFAGLTRMEDAPGGRRQRMRLMGAEHAAGGRWRRARWRRHRARRGGRRWRKKALGDERESTGRRRRARLAAAKTALGASTESAAGQAPKEKMLGADGESAATERA